MTAVEFLENKLKAYLSWSSFLEEDFNKAKEMERKQTIAFADRFAADCIGYSRVTSRTNDISRAEEYYNKLYETAE